MQFNRNTQRRSVSGESYTHNDEYTVVVIEKDEEVKKMLMEKLNGIFMFENLETPEKLKVVDAIKIKNVKKGDKVIVQGDQGDELFAVGYGQLR